VPGKMDIRDKGRIGEVDYVVKAVNLEDRTIIFIMAEPSEEKVPPKDYLKKTYSLDEFSVLIDAVRNLEKKLGINEMIGEINYFVITPEQELMIEKMKTISGVEITYGEIRNGKLNLEGVPSRVLTERLPRNITIMLPSKGDPKQLAESALNTQWALSIVRTYTIKLLKRYKDYLKVNEEAEEIVDKIFSKMKEISVKEIKTRELIELGEISKKIIEVEKAVVHDLANVEANYRNLENALRILGIAEYSPDIIIGKQVLEAWKTLLERLRAATEAVSTSYNIIRTKLQLENIEHQTMLMEIERRENKYLQWIEIFTGALIVNEIIKAIFLNDYITPIIVIVVSLIILFLAGREKKRWKKQSKK